MRPFFLVMMLLLPVADPVQAQASDPLPVQLEIVIARYQGTKRVSSLPYTLSLNGRPSNAITRLRMNGSVPVPATTRADDDKGPTVSSFNYREIGTNIDVLSIASTDGRLGFTITVTDSSLYGDGEVKSVAVAAGAPMFRSFNVSSAVHLRDGEMAEFTAATDRLTGEVTKVEVTLTVLK
jgi:hypothetical protein